MKAITFLCLTLLFSCTQMQENYRQRVCHYDGAFEEGTNDAQTGDQMRGEYVAAQCPDQVKADVRKGYRDGYVQSKASRPTSIVINNNSKENRRRKNDYNKMCIESLKIQKKRVAQTKFAFTS